MLRKKILSRITSPEGKDSPDEEFSPVPSERGGSDTSVFEGELPREYNVRMYLFPLLVSALK